MAQCYTAVQSQNAVSAYFTSKQILYFGVAERCSLSTYMSSFIGYGLL